MRLPRMTTRRWMVAVAVVGLVCFLEHRHRSLAVNRGLSRSRMVARMYPRSPVKGMPMGLGIPGPDITAERLAHSLADAGERVHPLRLRREPHDGGRREGRHLARGDGPKYREASRYPWLPVMPDPPMPSEADRTAGAE